ncbi:RNB domain-containing ribonuclease, partial [Salmonella enterica]
IKSNRRFVYEEAQQLLEDNGVIDGKGMPAPAPGKEGYKGEYAEQIILLDRFAKLLREKRFKNGSVNFDREEMRFEIDEHGKPLQ